jgi:hypothetical protein
VHFIINVHRSSGSWLVKSAASVLVDTNEEHVAHAASMTDKSGSAGIPLSADGHLGGGRTDLRQINTLKVAVNQEVEAGATVNGMLFLWWASAQCCYEHERRIDLAYSYHQF